MLDEERHTLDAHPRRVADLNGVAVLHFELPPKRTRLEPGSAIWSPQAHWFNNKGGYRPDGHIVLPFSTTTIERGLKVMRDRGYITAERKKRSPEGKLFEHPRLIYTNKFNEVGTAAVIDLTTRVRTA